MVTKLSRAILGPALEGLGADYPSCRGQERAAMRANAVRDSILARVNEFL